MPPNSQLNPAQEQQKIQLELAKRRSRKPTDKTIPEGVEEFIIGNGVANYKRLIEVERKLDSAAVRKRMDVQDSLGLGGNIKRFRTLRIWISNTVEDQEWQGGEATVDNFDFSMNRDASWKVKIEGRLLDDDEQDEDTESEDEEEGDKMEEDKKKSSEGEQRYKLFHFIKSLSVVFEPSRHHASISAPVVEWKKPILPASARGVSMPASTSADFDSIEFKRGGDENQNITIKLVTDENPERFKLSPELTEVLDQEEATRGEAVTGVWEYIKIMGLQEDAEKRTFRCDELLKKVSHTLTPIIDWEPTLTKTDLPTRHLLHPIYRRRPPQPPQAAPTNRTPIHNPHRRSIPQPARRTTADYLRHCHPARLQPPPRSLPLHFLAILPSKLTADCSA